MNSRNVTHDHPGTGRSQSSACARETEAFLRVPRTSAKRDSQRRLFTQRAGPRRHQDAPDAELVRHRRGMDRAGAAEGQQREILRIDAALGREDADLVGHAHVDDAADAGRRFCQCHLHRRSDFRLERDTRRGRVAYAELLAALVRRLER